MSSGGGGNSNFVQGDDDDEEDAMANRLFRLLLVDVDSGIDSMTLVCIVLVLDGVVVVAVGGGVNEVIGTKASTVGSAIQPPMRRRMDAKLLDNPIMCLSLSPKLFDSTTLCVFPIKRENKWHATCKRFAHTKRQGHDSLSEQQEEKQPVFLVVPLLNDVCVPVVFFSVQQERMTP